MLHYATDIFLGGIERIFANYDESGAFTTTIWPEVRHSIIENTSERLFIKMLCFLFIPIKLINFSTTWVGLSPLH